MNCLSPGGRPEIAYRLGAGLARKRAPEAGPRIAYRAGSRVANCLSPGGQPSGPDAGRELLIAFEPGGGQRGHAPGSGRFITGDRVGRQEASWRPRAGQDAGQEARAVQTYFMDRR